MAELEERLASVLNDPNMMQQIMNMAQSFNAAPATAEPAAAASEEAGPPIDLRMLKQLSGFAQQGNIDSNQRTLLKALGPYLSRDRIGKLEKAMRAAKVAQMTSGLLSASSFQAGR
jgi:hypothetical protein